MFTLLPEEYKKEMIGKYRRRVFITLMIGTVFVLVFSLLLQFSTYMTVRAEHNKLDIELKTLQAQIVHNNEMAIGINISDLNFDLNLLSSTTPSTLSAINSAFSYVVDGVNVSKVEYSSSGGSQFNLNLSGKAKRRIDLSLFNKSLKLEKMFKKIDLPIESLAKEADVDFNIKIDGSYE